MLTFSEIQEFKRQLQDNWDPKIELCGIISAEHEIIPTENLSETPEYTFKFAPEVLDGAIATYHSHPTTSANLSIADFWFFKSWPSIYHFIISKSEVRCYVNAAQRIYLVHEEEDYPPRTS